MVGPEDLNSRRMKSQEEINNQERINRETRAESNRQTGNQNTMPEILTNHIYTPAFLREQIGKLMRIEFLIGTNNMVDRIGFLEDVGASYILLRSFEGDSLIYADIYAIKFITISATYSGMPSYQNYNNMNIGINPNMNKYY